MNIALATFSQKLIFIVVVVVAAVVILVLFLFFSFREVDCSQLMGSQITEIAWR
jgi:uncharacterized membrane protein YqiK